MATGLLEVLKLKPPAGAPVAPAREPATARSSAGPAPGAAPAGSPAPSADDERTRTNARRLIAALDKGFIENVTRAQAAVGAQPVEALKKSLGTELDAFAIARASVDKAEPLEGARMMKKLDSNAHTFALRAETLLKSAADGVKYLHDRGDVPQADLKKTLDALAADVKAIYQ